MSHIKIRGGHSLHGEIEVQGAKNAALPIIAASVLNNGMVRLRRCPQIMDVHHMLRILQQSGACTGYTGGTADDGGNSTSRASDADQYCCRDKQYSKYRDPTAVYQLRRNVADIFDV